MEYGIAIAIIIILIFLVCREIVCWYFKFNEMLKELKSIREAIEKNGTKTLNLNHRDNA